MGRWEGGQEKLSSALRLTVGGCDLRTRAGVHMVQVTWTGVAGRTRAVVVEKLRQWQRENSGRGREKTSVVVTGR